MRRSCDVAIYGATPCGIAAACSAAARGASVLLLERLEVVGGHLTSGICTTECEHMLPESFTGWMLSFLSRLGAYYGLDFPIHRWEPKAALEVYRQLLDEAQVPVLYSFELNTLEKQGQRILSVTSLENEQVEAGLWIDASYEGDLMTAAGISYTIGRESQSTYGESLAGFRFIDSIEQVSNSKGQAMRIDQLWEVPLKRADGSPIEGVIGAGELSLERGAASEHGMNYHYRITVTRAAERIEFQRPKGYSADRYELLARYLEQYRQTQLHDILGFIDNPSGSYRLAADGFTDVIPGDKWELNNKQDSIISLGHLGGQFGYPDASYEARRAIIDDHYVYNAGMLYFLFTDPSVPPHIREEIALWGLPPDEYIDHGFWPYQPYIREARRMIGEYVLTERDLLFDTTKPDGIYLNSHWIDCHHVQRVAIDENHFRNEGRIWKELKKSYMVPYRAMLPRQEECSNLLVPSCLSSSHVAFCSIRLESTWMALGEVAGRAAALSLERQQPLHDLDHRKLSLID